jgi:hypothetical protein
METIPPPNRVPAWKKQRYHYNGFGQAKRRYTQSEAALAVREINAGKAFHTDLVESYKCKNCKSWHVGRSSHAHKNTTLWYEIGNRAYYNLVSENTNSRVRRQVRIRNRFRFLGELYGVQHVPKAGDYNSRLPA